MITSRKARTNTQHTHMQHTHTHTKHATHTKHTSPTHTHTHIAADAVVYGLCKQVAQKFYSGYGDLTHLQGARVCSRL